MKKIDFIQKHDPAFPRGGAFFKIQFSQFAAFPIYGSSEDFECVVRKLLFDINERAEEMIKDFKSIECGAEWTSKK